ncbi:cellulose synthase [Aurantimonas sp. HBX-1]|uniref:cellulose synthase n=1 Tax=Aurantimonas sp. HBX-1 TaxID=2906072 RepID=UPI001F43B847|nr:cellulose synthase [Aurantimonas sp. HBX-1]UIJ73144.1 cellulose synthase [Aurantimonas sp. HBX-1]
MSKAAAPWRTLSLLAAGLAAGVALTQWVGAQDAPPAAQAATAGTGVAAQQRVPWSMSAEARVPSDQPETLVAPADGEAPDRRRMPARISPFIAAAPLVAQSESAPDAPADAAAPAAAPAAGTPPVVDETALRYFARSGDSRRLEAEIARLQALYPDWTPPEDPLAIPEIGDPQLDRMWALYAEGKYAEVRAAVAARQDSEPGWEPPADLLERLNVAESRVKLVNASNLQQYDTVIRVASDTPSLLTCSEVDVLWRLAEAFAATNRPGRALDAYRYILTNCDNPGERLATMQMATQRLDRPAIDSLLALQRPSAEGIDEFASIRADLSRKAVDAGNADPDATASQEDLETVRRLAEADGAVSDRLLLGWYYLRRDAPAAAEAWFRKAREVTDSSEASQGLALALLALSQPVEAEAVIRPWAAASDEARAVYVAAAANLLAIDPPIVQTPEVLRTIVDAVAGARDANGAQQLGWYSYGLNQLSTAAQWFAQALDWQPASEPAAFGLALANQRLGNTAELSRLQAAWQGASPRIAAVGQAGATLPQTASAALAATAPSMQAAASAAPQPVAGMTAYTQAAAPTAAATATTAPTTTTAPAASAAPAAAPAAAAPAAPAAAPIQYEAPRPSASAPSQQRAAPRGCGASVDPRTLSAQAALDRGWCLMELGRPVEAAPAFGIALLAGSPQLRRDAAYGQSLAYLRIGLADKAAVAAAKEPQPRERRTELDTAILSTQAIDSFAAKRPVETLIALDQRSRIAADRLDLMVLQGYAYLELGRIGDAEQVFSAAANAGSRDAARGLNAVREATGYIISGD